MRGILTLHFNPFGRVRVVPGFCEFPTLEEVSLRPAVLNVFQRAPVPGALPTEPGLSILREPQPQPRAPFPGPGNAQATYRGVRKYVPRDSYIPAGRRSGSRTSARDTPDR